MRRCVLYAWYSSAVTHGGPPRSPPSFTSRLYLDHTLLISTVVMAFEQACHARPVDSRVKRNGAKRSGFGRLCQARQAVLGPE